MQKFVLFDFDGVIADSTALSYELSKRFHPELTDEMFRRLFEKNVFDSLKEMPGIDVRDHADEYYKLFNPRLSDETDLTSGMSDVIERLSTGYTIAIISSTPTSAIHGFLERHSLSGYFADVLGYDIDPSKVEKMRMIFAKYSIAADDCVYITDTLGDMREAKEHRMGTVGVSWGVHDHATLEKGIPFRIVDTPSELPDAVDDYFARSAQ